MNVSYPDGESMPGTPPLIRYSPPAANSVSHAYAWPWAFAGNNASRLGSYCGETLGGTCAQWVFLCAPPPSRFLDTNFTPGSPDARNVTTRAACCRFNHDVLREFPVPCLTAQAAPAFGHIAGDRRPSSLRSCLRPKD